MKLVDDDEIVGGQSLGGHTNDTGPALGPSGRPRGAARCGAVRRLKAITIMSVRRRHHAAYACRTKHQQQQQLQPYNTRHQLP